MMLDQFWLLWTRHAFVITYCVVVAAPLIVVALLLENA